MSELMTNAMPVLGLVLGGNSLAGWLVGLGVFFAFFVIFKIIRVLVIGRLKNFFTRTKTELDDIVINALDSIYWPFYLIASLYIASLSVNVPDVVSRWLFNIFFLLAAYYAIKFLSQLVDFGAKTLVARKEGVAQDDAIVRLMSTLAKVVLWSGAFILILSNLGFNVTSLIAGLGIGGIAIGLALQNVLGDLFSSLAIYLDKPFKTGDFIIVGEYMGTVKRVGIKTTRIQALRGEEIVMSNSDLTGSRVQNFGKMERRRATFQVGVTYDTPAEKLRRIPDIIKNAINNLEKSEFDRCHFKEFGDSAFIFEIVYYVLSPDMMEYLNGQQAVNLSLVEEFDREKIEFAFPTRTVYVKNS